MTFKKRMDLKKSLEQVQSKNCVIQIFGLGYIGFPLSIRLANSGFKVIGIDTDLKKIENLKNNNLSGSQLSLKTSFLKSCKSGTFVPSEKPVKTDLPCIGIICVPTPIPNNGKDSNLFVNSALEQFLEFAKKGDVIILESSIMIGTTDKIKTVIESRGFKVGQDFGLCFCPERIDPLNKKWKLENIPRIIYSYDDTTFEIAQKIYENVNNSNLIRVESPKVAEVVKSFENAFRLVNISLINELAMLCDKLKINVKDVIDAASTKPFGFMPFYPSAGAGGHCIPKDPTFLLESANKMGTNFTTIENSIVVNSIIPKYIVDSIEKTLDELNLEKSVLICGMSYKPDIEDMRDSPGFKILNELTSRKFKVATYDPYYKSELKERYLKENNLSVDFQVITNLDVSAIDIFNCICITQNHKRTQSRLEEIYNNSKVPFIYDCQNRFNPKTESKTILKRFGN